MVAWLPKRTSMPAVFFIADRLTARVVFAFPVIVACAIAVAQATTAYTITVEAGKTTGPLIRFWQNCIGADHMYTVLKTAYGGNSRAHFAIAKNELGMKGVRAHGILNDDVGVYKEDASGNPVYAWAAFDSIFDSIHSLGWKPIVELSFMPGALASGATTTCWYNGVPGNVTPPKDYNKWKNLIYQIVNHCKQRYGAAEIESWRWEVWNEPDIVPQFFTGSEEDYFRMYDYAVEGALRADSCIRIGGPSTALSDTGGLIKRFLNHCLTTNYADPSKKSTRVDFISWHQYPWNEGDQNATAYMGRNRGIVAFLKRYPALKLENIQTEWNASARYNKYFDDEANASFVAKTIHGLFPEMNQGAAPPDVFSFWIVSDIFEEYDMSSTSAYAGAMGLILRGRNAKKPAFHAFRMLAMLGDSLLGLTGGTAADATTGLNGFATINKNKTQLHVLIYDHNYGSGPNPAYTPATDTMHLRIRNIPFAPGKIKVERYAVDHINSNSYTTWVAMGRPDKPTKEQWDRIEKDGELDKIDSGIVTLTDAHFTKDYPQGRPGVSLLALTSQEMTGGGSSAPPQSRAARLSCSVRGGTLVLVYAVPRHMPVTLTVLNALGRRIAVPAVSETRDAGEHHARLPALPGGAYMCVLASGNTVLKRTMLVMP